MGDNLLNFVPEVMMLQPVVRDGLPCVIWSLSDSEENKNTDIDQNVDDEKNQWVVKIVTGDILIFSLSRIYFKFWNKMKNEL